MEEICPLMLLVVSSRSSLIDSKPLAWVFSNVVVSATGPDSGPPYFRMKGLPSKLGTEMLADVTSSCVTPYNSLAVIALLEPVPATDSVFMFNFT